MKTRQQLAASYEAIAEQNDRAVQSIIETLRFSRPDQYERRLELAQKFAREADELRENADRLCSLVGVMIARWRSGR
jgi:hypothetical protein